MANEQNLRHDFSPEEARENGRKGAEASAKARRKKRTMQETAQMILAMPCRQGTPEDAEYMADVYQRDKDGNLKFDCNGKPIPKNLTMEQASLIAIAKKAMNGDVKAMEFIRDTAGEKPIEKVEINADLQKAHENIQARIEARRKAREDG